MKIFTVVVPQREAWKVVQSFTKEIEAKELCEKLKGRIIIEKRNPRGGLIEDKEDLYPAEKKRRSTAGVAIIEKVVTKCKVCGAKIERDHIIQKAVCFNCKAKKNRQRALAHLFSKKIK